MYTPPTSRTSPNATSSPASADGRSHFVPPAGQMTDLFGPVPALANLSARQAKELGLLTSGTSGRHSTTSSSRMPNGAASKSAALQAFLESRLRARTQTLGSTLYKLTWKPWATPSGPSRSRLRASALRTSAIATTGWPTPTAALAEKGVRTFEGGLLEAMRTSGPDLAAASCLAGSITENMTGSSLAQQIKFASWTTQDGPARRTASGVMLTGSSAAMPSGGQLRPGHSRWLMGYPLAWDQCAPGYAAWQTWQALMAQVSGLRNPIESEHFADMATPSIPSRLPSSCAL